MVRGNARFNSQDSRVRQRTSEISCSTREINLVFQSINAYSISVNYIKDCLLKSDTFYRKAIIFTCEIIINTNLTCEIISFISTRNLYKALYFIACVYDLLMCLGF